MTRETKIGLLVGLAFIIVIGILLSDQRRSTLDPAPANIALAGSRARDAVNGPGSGSTPPLTLVREDLVAHGKVATKEELTQPVPPVIPAPARRDNRVAVETPKPIDPPVARQDEDHGASVPGSDPMKQLVREHPQELTQAAPDGRPIPATPVARTYKAQSGDSVSRMAGRFLGANTLKNRQAIIDSNPSLADDPDNVVIGHSYVIPGLSPAPASSPVAEAPTPRAAVSAGEYYTVEEGDSLWGIATNEVGDAGAIDAIKELNKNVLRGENHDVIRPGMKLRLPGKTVASAN